MSPPGPEAGIFLGCQPASCQLPASNVWRRARKRQCGRMISCPVPPVKYAVHESIFSFVSLPSVPFFFFPDASYIFLQFGYFSLRLSSLLSLPCFFDSLLPGVIVILAAIARNCAETIGAVSPIPTKYTQARAYGQKPGPASPFSFKPLLLPPSAKLASPDPVLTGSFNRWKARTQKKPILGAR